MYKRGSAEGRLETYLASRYHTDSITIQAIDSDTFHAI